MKVQHPTFDDVVYDVTDADAWVEQGWKVLDAVDETPASDDPAGDSTEQAVDAESTTAADPAPEDAAGDPVDPVATPVVPKSKK